MAHAQKSKRPLATPTARVMEELCVELDSVLVELMECLGQLEVLRRRLSTAVSEGYFNMAKARYSMGPLSVHPLNYDTVMRASCLVGAGPDAEDSTDKEPAGDGTVFRVYRHTNTDANRSVPEAVHSGEGEGSRNQLRKRRPQTGECDPGEEVEEVGRGGGGEGDKERRGEGVVEGEAPKDPLKWFGVLVPQSLRQSQENFIQATALCGELATVQSRLESMRCRYQTLRLQKQQRQQQQTHVDK